MEVRVELLVLRIDDFQAVLRERFLHLLINHGNACAEALQIGAFSRQCTLEIVQERQHVREDSLRDDGGKLLALFRRAAAEVVEVRTQAQHLCVFLLQVGFELLAIFCFVGALCCLLESRRAFFGSLRTKLVRGFRRFRLVDLALHLFELFLVLLLQLIFHE